MPISLDPNKTFDYVLEGDRDKSSPPSFTFRFLTCRQTTQVQEWLSELDGVPDAGVLAHLTQIVMLALVGWRNIEVPFSAEALLDVLAPFELWELATRYPREATSVGSKKNNSGSQSSCDTESSGATGAAPVPVPSSPSTSTTSPATNATGVDATSATAGA